MNRRELVQKVLIGSTALMVMPSAITSCSKDPGPDPGPGPNPGNKITIDLSLPANEDLNTVGNAKIIQDIIIANTGGGVFIALNSICTHQGCSVAYVLANDNFQCPCHGSVYSKTGSVVNGPAPTALKSYIVNKVGDILTINL